MKISRSLIGLILLAILTLGLSGCGSSSGGGGTQVLASIAVFPDTLAIQVGSSQTFTAAGTDTQGDPMTISPEWTLSALAAALAPIGTIEVSGTSCVFTAAAAGSGTLQATQSSISSNAVTITVSTTPPPPVTGYKMFFLHHSVGNNLIHQGSVRETIGAYNSAHGTSYAFWDHDYNDPGLSNAGGELTGTDYGIPGDNTNSDGLHALWTSSEAGWAAARDQIMSAANDYRIIAFKSCYIALESLDSSAVLDQWKAWYLEMRSYFDAHTDKLFVVMSPPPLRSADTSASNAALARQFADWLKSSGYLSGHGNIACFDLFDELAGADNFLKDEYESGDASHPNETANQHVGPIFADLLCDSAFGYFGH